MPSGTIPAGLESRPEEIPRRSSNDVTFGSEAAGSPSEISRGLAGTTTDLRSRKRRRVRTGCLQCKRRRVRCDENGRPEIGAEHTAGRCAACTRLGLPCTWPSVAQAVDKTSTKTRAKDAKRTGTGSPSDCDNDGNDTAVLDDTADRLGSRQVTRAMVDAFFEEVYPCAVFGFLRKDKIYELFDAGKISRGLILAMCSLSLKFVVSDHEEQSRKWTADAKSCALRDMENGQELFNRIFGAAWMTSGIAIRLAFALRLNMTPTIAPMGTQPMSWAEGESRRRMMWAVYVMDMYVCDGFPEYSNVPRSSLRIQLPCDEETFASNHGYESGIIGGPGTDSILVWPTPHIHPRSAASPFVQYIIIFSIRTAILRYIRRKAVYQDLPWNENSTVTRCGKALQWWKDNLPPELDIKNEEYFPTWTSAQLSTILSLHLWHCMSYCDLGRLTIFNFVECASPDILLTAPQSYVSDAQNKCVEYASSMLDLCRYVFERRPDFVSRDPYMASCLYQAIRILLWDIFRHPSPSISIKTFTASNCQPAIIMLHRLANLFSYAGSVMEDTFSLLKRYGMHDIMLSILPREVSIALCHSDRVYKPGPAIFLDPSEQSALRVSPEPTSPDQICVTTDRGESELFRPPFHARKDVRIELESMDSNKLSNHEELTPPSVAWNPPNQLSWQEAPCSVTDSQSNGSLQQHVYTDGNTAAGHMPDDFEQGVFTDMASRLLQMQNITGGRPTGMTSTVSSVLPGIFDDHLIKDSQSFGDFGRLPFGDPLDQLWPSMYSGDAWK